MMNSDALLEKERAVARARRADIAADFEPVGAGLVRCRYCKGWRPFRPTYWSLDMHWRGATHQAARFGVVRATKPAAPRGAKNAGHVKQSATAAASRANLRAEVLALLRAHPSGLDCREISRRCGVVQNRMSKTLAALEVDGLVAARRELRSRGVAASASVKVWSTVAR